MEEEYEAAPGRVPAGALAAGITLLLACGGLCLLLLAGDGDATTTPTTARRAGAGRPEATGRRAATTAATRRRGEPPSPPPPDARAAAEGYVAEVRTAGVNESLFWQVAEGASAVTLTRERNGERIAYVCVWDGAPPRGLAPGKKVRIRGQVHVTTPGGAKVLTGCELE